jgi:hypothetical protein
VSDLLRGRIDLFNTDSLIDTLARLQISGGITELESGDYGNILGSLRLIEAGSDCSED